MLCLPPFRFPIDGVGTGDPSTGYSDCASIGQYTISGTVPGSGANQPPTANASATPTSGQGTYIATLIVTDNGGLSSTATMTIMVTPPPNKPPIAAALATPSSGYAPLAVGFSSAGFSDPDGTMTGYSWNFGDGATSIAQDPSHTYSSAGTFTATLTVTDNRGGTNSKPVAIAVTSDPTKVLHVQGILMSTVTSRAGTSGRARLNHEIAVHRESGAAGRLTRRILNSAF